MVRDDFKKVLLSSRKDNEIDKNNIVLMKLHEEYIKKEKTNVF